MVFLPASFTILLFVQCLMIIARGRTRGSISTYVFTIRVFSNAKVLLTFMSHARPSCGSNILTIGTLAVDTQMTLVMPPVLVSYDLWTIGSDISLLAKSSAMMQTPSRSFQSVVMHMSTGSCQYGPMGADPSTAHHLNHLCKADSRMTQRHGPVYHVLATLC